MARATLLACPSSFLRSLAAPSRRGWKRLSKVTRNWVVHGLLPWPIAANDKFRRDARERERERERGAAWTSFATAAESPAAAGMAIRFRYSTRDPPRQQARGNYYKSHLSHPNEHEDETPNNSSAIRIQSFNEGDSTSDETMISRICPMCFIQADKLTLRARFGCLFYVYLIYLGPECAPINRHVEAIRPKSRH